MLMCREMDLRCGKGGRKWVEREREKEKESKRELKYCRCWDWKRIGEIETRGLDSSKGYVR